LILKIVIKIMVKIKIDIRINKNKFEEKGKNGVK
jgi:hypothetical protein